MFLSFFRYLYTVGTEQPKSSAITCGSGLCFHRSIKGFGERKTENSETLLVIGFRWPIISNSNLF